ncbi:2-polyprenyl-6-methoxyphenol hydroxylase-like FAD-dependent oxidoreductase [Actinomycetospora succinea]|uniref:2-polyprenyl-6-methoxyphenol hydroxylase-like FAD-dependent oxidoreductase n=1 Tax=Actinomycetospora succinea TaxID=663603 RepID=A0A4R6VAD9_9PSEU|nr:FAD-dependent monooxygenase [Actinomycetospora succinea]TDQ58907.1 2-polyprenyl-6-methoxyphenol hydroxylase-like FAD-dependent oxidoreductase [Actinomycetospora succinea]
MGTPSILVSGASIAGPAAAWWLAAAGWDVTVVERFAGLRDEGQNVDVRGTGREVLRRAGLEDAARAHHTSETGLAFVDADGRAFASFPAGADDADSSPTAELEILRGQLARLLYDRSAGAAGYVFGDEITALHDDGRGVEVEFARGPARRFDAVVIAEGSRSRTRDLVFPDARVDELGLLAAYLTIPRTADDDRQWRIFFGGRGRLVHLRPDNVGTTRAMLSLSSDVRGLDRLDREGVVAVLRATYGDLGWETPRVLAGLDDDSLHVDQIAQVRLPTWHRGRVALLGDAAWCAGPFGTGTTSALAGAYVLAGELGATPDDVPAAFARYEGILRPQVDRAQDFVPRHGHPRVEWRRRLLRAGLRVAGGPLGSALARVGLFDPSLPVDVVTLPDYPVRASSAV